MVNKYTYNHYNITLTCAFLELVCTSGQQGRVPGCDQQYHVGVKYEHLWTWNIMEGHFTDQIKTEIRRLKNYSSFAGD
jgi:hypothetical protein